MPANPNDAGLSFSSTLLIVTRKLQARPVPEKNFSMHKTAIKRINSVWQFILQGPDTAEGADSERIFARNVSLDPKDVEFVMQEHCSKVYKKMNNLLVSNNLRTINTFLLSVTVLSRHPA